MTAVGFVQLNRLDYRASAAGVHISGIESHQSKELLLNHVQFSWARQKRPSPARLAETTCKKPQVPKLLVVQALPTPVAPPVAPLKQPMRRCTRGMIAITEHAPQGWGKRRRDCAAARGCTSQGCLVSIAN